MPTLFRLARRTPKQRRVLSDINGVLRRLLARKLREIHVTDLFARSKLAWKVAVLQQALLYRVVMLAEGTASACNQGNVLTSILAARALVETCALAADFEKRLTTLIKDEDLKGLDAVVTNRLFSSRDPEFTAGAPEAVAVNILTFIDRLDKMIPGLRRHYDSMSERCHPNQLGHRQLFSTIDASTKSVSFSDVKDLDRNVDHILTGVLSIVLFERTMEVVDEAIPELADLQHRLDPVKRE